MLITKEVEVTINAKNKKHYKDLGYIIPERKNKQGNMTTPKGTIIIIKTEHLPKGSNVFIECLCDYCLEDNIETIISKQYITYIKQNEKAIIHKDCCKKCGDKKLIETNLEKYGVERILSLKEMHDKAKNTSIDRYGVEGYLGNTEMRKRYDNTIFKKYNVKNISQSEIIKERKIQTFLNHFGVDSPFKVIEIKEKIKRNNNEKYGVDYYCQTEECRNKMMKTSMERYNVPYPLQNPEIKEKLVAALCKNNNIPTSSQQILIFNMLKDIGYNVELNYPISRIALDIMLIINNIKIDIEYDCWYWHKNKQKEDRKRDEFTKSQGYKILRIKSNKKIPTIEQLQFSIDKLVNTNRTFTQIILDDWGIEVNNSKEAI